MVFRNVDDCRLSCVVTGVFSETQSHLPHLTCCPDHAQPEVTSSAAAQVLAQGARLP